MPPTEPPKMYGDESNVVAGAKGDYTKKPIHLHFKGTICPFCGAEVAPPEPTPVPDIVPEPDSDGNSN